MISLALISQMQYKAERLLLAALMVALCALCGLYMYLLSSSVVHVVISKEADARIHDMHSEISALEAEYMEVQSGISREIVEHRGYITASNKIFIDRGDASLVTKR